MQLVDSFEKDPPFYASFMSRRKDSFKSIFLNEVSSTLFQLRSGKKNIPVNLINIEDTNTNTLDTSHIDESNNISNNDIVPETAYMGQSQQQLVDLDMPLGDIVPVTVAAPFLASCGASALPLSPSMHSSSISSAPNLSTPNTNTIVVSNNEVLPIPP